MIKPIENFDGYFISDDGGVYYNFGKGNRRNDKTVDLYPMKRNKKGQFVSNFKYSK